MYAGQRLYAFEIIHIKPSKEKGEDVFERPVVYDQGRVVGYGHDPGVIIAAMRGTRTPQIESNVCQNVKRPQ